MALLINTSKILPKPFLFIIKNLDKPLTLMILAVSVISCFAVYSSSHDEMVRFYQHLRNIFIAGLLIVCLSHVPSVIVEKFAIPAYSITIVLLIATELFGETVNGATRWVDLGFLKMQPSEILKITLPLLLAWVIQRTDGLNSKRDWLFVLTLFLFPLFLVLRQPDLGTSILLFVSGAILLFFAGLPWRVITVGLIGFLLILLLLFIFGEEICAENIGWPGLRDYQKLRICTLLDPMRDPLGAGFHTIQSITAVGSGGMFGKGWLLGTQTQLAFIPERSTDFVFSGFAEEFGFAGSLILILLYGGITLRGLWISIGAPTGFARLLGGTLSMMTFTYACVNIGMVTGVLPVVGVPLPWMSYGGTALITLGVGVGLLMSIGKDRSETTQGFSLQR